MPAFVLEHPGTPDHRASGPTPPTSVRNGRAGLASVPATAPPPPPPTTVPTPTTVPSPTAAPLPEPASTPATEPPGAPPAAPAPAPASTPAPGPSPLAAPLPRTHVVAPGENLWVIAAAQLAGATGRAPSTLEPEEIAPYWHTVCDANRATLRSGNPSLIYPGEVVELPGP